MSDAARFEGVIVGDPGTRWTNNTERAKWQLIVSFDNSCAVCIQNANAISNWWPIPFHTGCNCRQIPVAPGAKAEPFLDFQKEVEALDPAQQSRVMGAGNYKLVTEGKVAWTDVVTKTRIRPLHEVVQRARLSEKELIKSGISPRVAREAIAKVQTPTAQAANSAATAAIDRLKQAGMTREQIRAAVRERLAARVRIFGKPSGPSGPGIRPSPPTRPGSPPGGGGFTSPTRPHPTAPAASSGRIAARPRQAAQSIARIIATEPVRRAAERIPVLAEAVPPAAGEALPTISAALKAAITRKRNRDIAALQEQARTATTKAQRRNALEQLRAIELYLHVNLRAGL